MPDRRPVAWEQERKALLGAGWTAPFVPGREGDEAALLITPGQRPRAIEFVAAGVIDGGIIVAFEAPASYFGHREAVPKRNDKSRVSFADTEGLFQRLHRADNG